MSHVLASATILLLMAGRIQRLVGERVVVVFELPMGLIPVAIPVEMLIRGIQQPAPQLSAALPSWGGRTPACLQSAA